MPVLAMVGCDRRVVSRRFAAVGLVVVVQQRKQGRADLIDGRTERYCTVW